MNQGKKKSSSMSLTVTLSIAFFSLSLSALLISGAVQIVSYYRTQQETIAGKQYIIAQDAASKVTNYIEDKQRIIETVLSTTNIIDSKYEQKKIIMESTFAFLPEFRQLSFLNINGRQIVNISKLSTKGSKITYQQFLSEMLAAVKEDKNYVSPIFIDDSSGEPMLIIAIPAKNIFGDVKNLMVAEMNLKFMWDFMDQIKVGNKGYAYVVDREGTLIAYKDNLRVLKRENLGKIKSVKEFIKNTKKNHDDITTYVYRGINKTRVVGAYISLMTPDWAVITEVPVSEAYKEVRTYITISTIIILIMSLIAGFVGIFIARKLSVPLINLTRTAAKIAEGETGLQAELKGFGEIATLAVAFNSMTTQLKNKAEKFQEANEFLVELIGKAREIIVNLNSSSKEIEAAAQEQTSGANENASGITEVSATLEELTITAKQITKNVGELVFSSEEIIKLLQDNESQLLHTVSQLDDVGKISKSNSLEIVELGKRSTLINEMVELIKDVANKTNILSINASIEASRSGEAGSGFSVVAAEIRELSKETISSAKNVEKAAKEIQDFLNSIIISSESETEKVINSGKVVRSIYDNIQNVVSKINNNYTFTQKIDVSIKQQETGSKQAADTMKQMAEIARQSAETARQTLIAVKDIVNFSSDLDQIVQKFKEEDED